MVILMSRIRVHGFFSRENYDYLLETKANLIQDGYNTASISKIIELGIMELKNDTNYDEIKRMLIRREMIK